MKIRYSVCGLGYYKNNFTTDYIWEFGDFDTYEEAYNCFVQLQCKDEASFFIESESNVYKMQLRLEKCEVIDNCIDWIDVKNEWWIINPDFKEEA